MEAKPQKTGLIIRVILGVSLAFNLLILGAFVGSGFSGAGHKHSKKPMRSADSAIGIYGRALNKSERREVGQRIHSKGRGERENLRPELRGLAAEAVLALRSDSFDPEVFNDILNRQQELIKTFASDARIALADYVAEMSPEARAEYADRLEAIMQRGHKRSAKK